MPAGIDPERSVGRLACRPVGLLGELGSARPSTTCTVALASPFRRSRKMKRNLIVTSIAIGIGSMSLLSTAAAQSAHVAASKAQLQTHKGKLGTFIVDGKGLT